MKKTTILIGLSFLSSLSLSGMNEALNEPTSYCIQDQLQLFLDNSEEFSDSFCKNLYKVVNTGNFESIYKMLGDTLQYPANLSESRKIYLNFLMLTLDTINIENHLHLEFLSVQARKKPIFKELCQELNQKIQHLIHFYIGNKNALDQANIESLGKLNTCFILMTIKLCKGTPTIKALINYCGLNVNIKDHNGNTPIHLLTLLPINRTRKELMRCFLDNGIDVNAQNKKGDTALHKACSKSNRLIYLKYLDLFLNHGADINMANHKGDTFLHKICIFPEIEPLIKLVKNLIENAKANVNIKNFKGFKPIHIARANNNIMLTRILLRASKKYPIEPNINMAKSLALYKLLIKHCPDKENKEYLNYLLNHLSI